MSDHPAETSLDSFDLLQQMRKDGLAMEKRGLSFKQQMGMLELDNEIYISIMKIEEKERSRNIS